MKYLKDQNSINMKIKLFKACIFFSFSTFLLAELNIVRAFPNLQFDQLVDLQSPNDNSNRIFILEQEGEIYVFQNLDSVSDTTQFLDIRDKVEFQGEMGLLGLAFHPDYENNGYFFINYIAPDPRRTVIARYEISATDSNTANSESEMIILEINQPYNNHNGGQVAFGPDGYLYIGMGDGGSGGDPLNHGQNLGTLHGAMLRIDINNVGEENNYVIPSDNPYVNNNEGHREEIYAYGFRNPWRFSFDNFTGNCWIADVGQDEYEEISILEQGGNFGWNIMEGFHCFNPSINCDTSGLILPIYEYDHSIGESITGGYVYRGMMLPSLIGKYIFADFEYGHIYALEYNDLNNLHVYSIGDLGPYSVTSFGVDHNNEIYICKLNGEIYKFLDDSVISAFQPQTNGELQTAVDMWIDDNDEAMETYGEINEWDVSLITTMALLFDGSRTEGEFNDDISNWNVSNVTDMQSMFRACSSFNQSLSIWDVSNVTNMASMFSSAKSFNGDITTWDVSSVTRMDSMFFGLITIADTADNQSFNQDISSWDVSNVNNMEEMFSGVFFFNQDLSNWDVSNVTNMGGMFKNAIYFNGDVSTWDVSSVTRMDYMFSNLYVFTESQHHIPFVFHSTFNQDISGWDVSSVTSMERMFYNAESFNQDLSTWDVSNVTNMIGLFQFCDNFNGDVSTWDVSSVTNMGYMFSSSIIGDQSYGGWGPGFFPRTHSFNGDLSTWDVSSVTNMKYMFARASSFNGDLSTWDVSNVTDMSNLFQNANNFNQDISAWDVSSVTNMRMMFTCVVLFNQDISAWDVSNVTNMGGMFKDASYNGDLSTWDVSNVTNMVRLFEGCDNFNGDLSTWDVSSVTDMERMFARASSFNGDLSTWDVSSVTDMGEMFFRTDNFNQDISNWDISNVTNINRMFNYSTNFNQDLSNWNVSNINSMGYVFDYADALSDENKCAIHNSWSVQNTGWTYDWSMFCDLKTDISFLVPKSILLHQNYPNPFNPITQINYDLPYDELVNISIYDMSGRMVKTLISSSQTAGYKAIQWDATNNQGQLVSAGVYLYSIEAGEFRQIKKMVLLK